MGSSSLRAPCRLCTTPHSVSTSQSAVGAARPRSIHGVGFEGGSDYKRRFGGSTVSASYDPVGETLHCASAPHSPRTAFWCR